MSLGERLASRELNLNRFDYCIIHLVLCDTENGCDWSKSQKPVDLVLTVASSG